LARGIVCLFYGAKVVFLGDSWAFARRMLGELRWGFRLEQVDLPTGKMSLTGYLSAKAQTRDNYE